MRRVIAFARKHLVWFAAGAAYGVAVGRAVGWPGSIDFNGDALLLALLVPVAAYAGWASGIMRGGREGWDDAVDFYQRHPEAADREWRALPSRWED